MNNSFYRYCFNRTGFGRTSWPSFAFTMLLSLALLAYAFTATPDGSWAKGVAYAFGFGVPCVLVFGTWMNYKGRWV